MKKLTILFLLILLSISCVPIRIAPNIKDYKIKVAKKFKRKLPKNFAFIFEDPGKADEFYNFINSKYNLYYKNVETMVPFSIENNNYYLSFYEQEIPTKHLNLFPVFIDLVFNGESSGDRIDVERIGYWYLVLTVFDLKGVDCLNPNYRNRIEVIYYLKNLKQEYLNSMNEQEID